MTTKLEDACMDVAWRLTAVGTYRGEKKRALAALRRRVRSSTPDECEFALNAAIEFVKTGEALLDEHAEQIWESAPNYDFSPLYPSLEKSLAIFSEKTVHGMLSLILLYYHLM